MRYIVLILLSTALPAYAGLDDMFKDRVQREIDRRAPVPTPSIVLDAPGKRGAVRYNLRWRISGKVGPFTFKDEIGDDHLPRIGFSGNQNSFRQENLSRFVLQIRKEF